MVYGAGPRKGRAAQMEPEQKPEIVEVIAIIEIVEIEELQNVGSTCPMRSTTRFASTKSASL